MRSAAVELQPPDRVGRGPTPVTAPAAPVREADAPAGVGPSARLRSCISVRPPRRRRGSVR
ncbi:MAG: hypothetical protein JO284_16020 [Planctomycetaceae bacterium]|nr:hypothetical protein [Planctomycetaceae bacterium]